MQYYNTFIPFFLILSALRLHAYLDGLFSKGRTVAHPETGLFLDYIGQYTPSEKIIHNSAIFPMTTATCHFLPLSAAENIPSCNITIKRRKRFIDPISLGVGVVSLGMSVTNSIQIGNLQQEVALVESTLSKLSQTVEIHGAHLTKLSLQQIEITAELQKTQKAINDIIPILDSHATAINTLKAGLEQLYLRVKHSFLYLAITQICRNDLTLSFLQPEDVHKVVYEVIKLGNLTFNSYPGSLPIVQIITKLLVRQQIDFIPRSQYITEDSLEEIDDPDEIGRLVITSFFAVPRQEQTSFHVYRLVTIPFFYKNETMELTQMPQYWAIDPTNNNTMEWHDPGKSGCDLQLMTTCRDTPLIRTISTDNCFDQIIEEVSLSGCHTTRVPTSSYFYRQLRDNFWITSSPAPIHCLKIPRSEHTSAMKQTWNMNEEIILPSVSLVNVTEGYTIECPGFTLIGRTIKSNVSSLVIMYNKGLLTKNISVINVHQYITQNMTWFKKNKIDEQKKELKDFIDKTRAIANLQPSFSTPIWSYVSSSSWIVVGLIAVVVYLVLRRR